MIVGGIVAALLGAVVLAFGAQYQNRGVQAQRGGGRSLALVRSPRWLLGSGLLTVAVLLQLVGLLLAPLPVVQPLGVLSLVVTALLNRRFDHARLQRRGIQGIALSVVGTAVFVGTASVTTRSSPQDAPAILPVLVLAGTVLLVLLVGYLVARRRLPAIVYALSGGTCFGFVVTLMKVVLDRCSEAVQHGGLIDAGTPFTLLVAAGAAAAGIAGISLVQVAYEAGSPDLVVAALTVIDPLVAVALGIVLLGEARSAPPWAFAVFGVAEAVGVIGVVLMALHPPVPESDDGSAQNGPDGR